MGEVAKYLTNGTLGSKITSGSDYFLDPGLNAVALDSAGNIYVVSSGYHYVIKFDSKGTYVKKWGSFGTGDTQFSIPSGITIDAGDNIYICDKGNRRIVKYDASGNFLAKWDIQVAADSGASDPSGWLRVDAAGRINLVDWRDYVFKVFDSNGALLKRWSKDPPLTLSGGRGVGFDGEGNIYVAKYVPLEMYVVKFDSNGTYLTHWGGDIAGFAPSDVVVDSENYIYVADTDNNRITKFRSTWLPTLTVTAPAADDYVAGPNTIQATASSEIGISKVEFYLDGAKLGEATGTPVAARAVSGSAEAPAAASSASTAAYSFGWNTMFYPDGKHTLKVIASNTQGKTAQREFRIFVRNDTDDQVPTVTITSPLATDKVHFGTTIQATATDDGPIVKVEFYVDGTKIGEDTAAPYSWAWDASGLADGLHEVKAEATDTTGFVKSATVTVWVGNSEEFTLVAKWTMSFAPYGLAVDASGNIYVSGAGTVEKYRSDGTLLMRISNAADYTFHERGRIALDGAGNIYVTANTSNFIYKFDRWGTFLKKWGLTGTGDAVAIVPTGIAVSGNYLFVGDQGNHRIVKYDLDGAYLGRWGSAGSGNGQFGTNDGICIDSTGNLYVANGMPQRVEVFKTDGTFVRNWKGVGPGLFDSPVSVGLDPENNIFVCGSNHRVVKFKGDGVYLAGWGSQGSGDANFSSPTDVVVDSSNYVYVADRWNSRILKFRSTWLPALEVISPLADASVSGTHTIQATATSDLGVSKVEVYVDGVKLGEAAAGQAAAIAAAYTYPWNTTGYADGPHALKLIAYNTQGTTTQREFTVVVNNSNDQAPKVAVSYPLDGLVVAGTVAAKATASDDKGIVRVDYFLDDVLLGSVTTAPYDYNWDTTKTADGRHTLKVTAVDTLGQKTSVSLNVVINNAGAFFNVDLTNADVIFLTKDYKLKKVDTNGNQGYVVKSTIQVKQFQFDPQGNLFIKLFGKQELPDGKKYLLIKVDPKTNLMKGIDPSLDDTVWLSNSISPNIQFDGAGNVYYFSDVTTTTGILKVLRKYIDENHIEDIINDNIGVSHWQVLSDGQILISGTTKSSGQTWLRRINPASADNKVLNLAECATGWLARFPDGQVYTHLSGSYVNLEGIYKIPSDLHRLTQADSDAPYIGSKPGSTHTIDSITAGHSLTSTQGFRDSRGQNMFKIWTDRNNNLYGLTGMGISAYQYLTILRLYPTPEVVELKLINKILMMDVSLGQLVVAGFDEVNGVYKLVIYDLQTKTETNIMYRNIEIYHLGVLYDGSIIFDGLDLLNLA